MFSSEVANFILAILAILILPVTKTPTGLQSSVGKMAHVIGMKLDLSHCYGRGSTCFHLCREGTANDTMILRRDYSG